jgi:Ca2+-transporting ATPase
MVDAIEAGRKIYDNLKKAFRYIISIHIPIILVVTIPLVLGWKYPNIFTPIHVIFLELIMGPTCSIIYENEPAEPGIMEKGPRRINESLFSWPELSLSILQGLIISLGVLAVYQYCITQNSDLSTTRTWCFTTLIFSNIILTLANRSFTRSIFVTLLYKNYLIPIIIFITLALWWAAVNIPMIQSLFGFSKIDLSDILLCAVVGSVSVLWLEIYKMFKRKN